MVVAAVVRGTGRRALAVAARFGLAAAYASLFLHTSGELPEPGSAGGARSLSPAAGLEAATPPSTSHASTRLHARTPPTPAHPAELFPVVVREHGLGACNAVGRAGAALAPLCAFLQAQLAASFVPLLVLGCAALAGAALCLGLPETLGEAPPATIQDLNVLLAMRRKRSWRLSLAGYLRREPSSQASLGAAA